MHKFENLNTKVIAKKVIYYEQIDSTQKEIWRRIDKHDIENGTLIYAGLQTKGIGTHGRTWYTNEKDNIAFSFAIFPNISIKRLEGLTKNIAEAIVEVLKKLYNVELQIKQPNDIVYNGKKIGGILTETKINGEIVKYVVIGIGINTNQEKFNNEIKNIATSIKKEFDIKVDSKKIITEFCNEFEEKIIKRIGR